jgi:hypothetical protein
VSGRGKGAPQVGADRGGKGEGKYGLAAGARSMEKNQIQRELISPLRVERDLDGSVAKPASSPVSARPAGARPDHYRHCRIVLMIELVPLLPSACGLICATHPCCRLPRGGIILEPRHSLFAG